jgi:hypothetical protein
MRLYEEYTQAKKNKTDSRIQGHGEKYGYYIQAADTIDIAQYGKKGNKEAKDSDDLARFDIYL